MQEGLNISESNCSSVTSFDIDPSEFKHFPSHRLHLDCIATTLIEPFLTPHRPFDVVEHIMILYLLLNPQLPKDEEKKLMGSFLRSNQSFYELRKRLYGVPLLQAAKLLVIGREKGLAATFLAVKWAEKADVKRKCEIIEFVEIRSLRTLLPSISESQLENLIDTCTSKIRTCASAMLTVGEVNNLLQASSTIPSSNSKLMADKISEARNFSPLEHHLTPALSAHDDRSLDSKYPYKSSDTNVLSNIHSLPTVRQCALVFGLKDEEISAVLSKLSSDVAFDDAFLPYLLAEKRVFG